MKTSPLSVSSRKNVQNKKDNNKCHCPFYMGRSGLSCSLALNGNSVFCHRIFNTWQKHSSLRSFTFEPQNALLPLLSAIKKEATKVTSFFIWAAVDSNHRPHPYQGCALTTWASSPYFNKGTLASIFPRKFKSIIDIILNQVCFSLLFFFL